MKSLKLEEALLNKLIVQSGLISAAFELVFNTRINWKIASKYFSLISSGFHKIIWVSIPIKCYSLSTPVNIDLLLYRFFAIDYALVMIKCNIIRLVWNVYAFNKKSSKRMLIVKNYEIWTSLRSIVFYSCVMAITHLDDCGTNCRHRRN